MGVFFKPQSSTADSALDSIVSDALALERIDSSVERDRKARELLKSRGRTSAVKTPDPDWKRVGIAFALLIAVFFVAMALAKTPEYEKLSEAVLRFFELLYTGILALLGIEAAKQS